MPNFKNFDPSTSSHQLARQTATAAAPSATLPISGIDRTVQILQVLEKITRPEERAFEKRAKFVIRQHYDAIKFLAQFGEGKKVWKESPFSYEPHEVWSIASSLFAAGLPGLERSENETKWNLEVAFLRKWEREDPKVFAAFLGQRPEFAPMLRLFAAMAHHDASFDFADEYAVRALCASYLEAGMPGLHRCLQFLSAASPFTINSVTATKKRKSSGVQAAKKRARENDSISSEAGPSRRQADSKASFAVVIPARPTGRQQTSTSKLAEDIPLFRGASIESVVQSGAEQAHSKNSTELASASTAGDAALEPQPASRATPSHSWPPLHLELDLPDQGASISAPMQRFASSSDTVSTSSTPRVEKSLTTSTTVSDIHPVATGSVQPAPGFYEGMLGARDMVRISNAALEFCLARETPDTGGLTVEQITLNGLSFSTTFLALRERVRRT